MQPYADLRPINDPDDPDTPATGSGEPAPWPAALLTCGQCCRRLTKRACGPTHAVLKAAPERHRDHDAVLAAHPTPEV